MMKYIVNIIAFISAFVLTAFAGWNTELFDGESKRWGYGYERAQQCYSGVVERAEVTWGDSWTNEVDITLRRWGSSWTLKEAKKDIEDMLEDEYWVNTAENGGDNYATWFSSGTNNFPRLNTSNILVNAGAPTNWFDDDPHWGAVTHSNGWGYLDEVINEMYVVESDIHYDAGDAGAHDWLEYRERYATTLMEEGYPSWSTNWANVKTTNETLWANAPTGDTIEMWLAAKDSSSTNTSLFDSISQYFLWFDAPRAGTESTTSDNNNEWYAQANNREAKYIITNATEYSATAAVYIRGKGIEGMDEYGQDATKIVDIQMSGVSTNYSMFGGHTLSGNTNYVSEWVGGPQDYTQFPNWVAAATTNDVYNGEYVRYSRTRGYSIDGFKVLMDFSATNGFEYVE